VVVVVVLLNFPGVEWRDGGGSGSSFFTGSSSGSFHDARVAEMIYLENFSFSRAPYIHVQQNNL
jgi:hypothetical protein